MYLGVTVRKTDRGLLITVKFYHKEGKSELRPIIFWSLASDAFKDPIKIRKVIVAGFETNFSDDRDLRNNLSGIFYGVVKIPQIKGLSYRVNFSNNYTWDALSNSSPYDAAQSGRAIKINRSTYDVLLDNILTYDGRFGKDHGLNVTLLYGANKITFDENRSAGNTEAVWVAQMEVDVPGGLLISTGRPGNILERQHVPASWTLQDPDGKPAVLGWRSDLNTGGLGVSFLQPTAFFENTLWQSDFDNDMRNSEFNYIRDFRYDDPASAWLDSSAVKYPGPNLMAQAWRWYPWLSKVTTPGRHPEALFANAELGLLSSAGGSTYADQYYIRLAETYLLRAEAYLQRGEVEKAAADINVVRARSNANPVISGVVDIDFILDERARELSIEEDRRITLQRLGKLVERVRLYNPHNADEIEDFHEEWPIPATEIEANINTQLAQNPGY